jgi:hypothetical protein
MKLELKHIAPYLPYELKVQYKGIINTKELSDYKKLEPKNVELFSSEYSKYWDNIPKQIEGLKISEIKQIKFFKKYITFHLGIRHGHLKTCFLGDIKPILRPLSDLTKEIEVNGEKFVPYKEIIGDEYSNYLLKISKINPNKFDVLSYMSVDVYYFLIQFHFDVFGLIPQGLAIDINTLKQ